MLVPVKSCADCYLYGSYMYGESLYCCHPDVHDEAPEDVDVTRYVHGNDVWHKDKRGYVPEKVPSPKWCPLRSEEINLVSFAK